MRSHELKVTSQSDYYVYAPSALAQKLYLYPVSIGHFFYEPGYFIHRNNFDSFLIMYIAKGNCEITFQGQTYIAHTGDFVFLNCYLPHRYGNENAWEAYWIHFDGKLAYDYYSEVSSRYGHILSPYNSKELFQITEKLYESFRNSSPIVESVFSDYLTRILNGFLISTSENGKSLSHSKAVTDCISFINEYFREAITLETIAKKANLSLYHFTRIFAKETGFTPHQYLINTRISAAKFMLKSSETSIKDIAFSTGFNSESNFCSTFKKWEGITPSQFRNNILE